MATGTVSSFTDDNWQLIQTSNATSGTSINFTGIIGYKKLMLKWISVNLNSTGQLFLTLNNDTSYYATRTYGKFSYGTWDSWHTTGKMQLCTTSYSNNFNGYITIDNALQVDAVKYMDGMFLDQSYSSVGEGGYMGTGPITSIQFKTDSGQTFSSGTLSLYGIAG